MRESDINARAGVINVRARMPASRSGCNAADTSSASASATRTAWRFALAVDDVGAISTSIPCVSIPASRIAAIASARIRAYEPLVTTA